MARSRKSKSSDDTRVIPPGDELWSDCQTEIQRDSAVDDHATRYPQTRNRQRENPPAKAHSTSDFESEIRYTDKFAIRGMIGRGGTSRVLLGFDTLIGREVALKELLGSERPAGNEDSLSREMAERFEREIEITGQLEHPGIVPVYEAGFRKNGIGFYAMKYVRGRTLKEAIERCESLSPELSFAHRMKLLDNIIDVCDAVAYAHSKEIIHRDLKPENIVIGRFGETVVIDWGLAKILGRDETLYGLLGPDQAGPRKGEDLTRVHSIFGTPRYMSPEQAGGQTGKFSDVYSLGSVLFHVLTGKPAYSGTLNEIIARLTDHHPSPSPREALPFVPAELAAICEKAMAKDPAKRFADARELAEQLHAYRDGRLISTYDYSRRELLRRFVSRNKSWMLAALVVLIAVFGGAAASLKYALEAHDARIRADAALIDVTALSQMSIRHSQEITETVERRLAELIKDMSDSGNELARIGTGNNPGIPILLRELHSRYPDIDHILLVDATGTIRDYSPGKRVKSGEIDSLSESNSEWLQQHVLTSQIGRIFERGNDEMYLPLQSMIVSAGKNIGRLVALLRPTHFLSDLIYAATPSGKVRPQAWLMQDDGLILFDQDPQKVGVNLYTDMELRGSPSLQALAIRVKTEETGIGYYSLSAENREVDKVTAWDTLELDDDLEWKVISYFEYQSH
ncbi:MAG: serine/threonine protein kinase [Gammaproteobacteria bacterium]